MLANASGMNRNFSIRTARQSQETQTLRVGTKLQNRYKRCRWQRRKLFYEGNSSWAPVPTAIGSNSSANAVEFLKVSRGQHGLAALIGEFESTLAIHKIVGDYTPKPIAWGSFKKIPDAHFYICKFFELRELEKLPEVTKFCEAVAKLHSESQSPTGKFGFHVATYNGNLPQNNDWTDTWEEFFSKGFSHMLDMNVKRGGPWPEMEELRPAMLSKVIPRLLRPLEMNGRTVKPSLVHGDLWYGNTAVDAQTNRPLIYDPASFYAHSEYELGNWRPVRNKFSSDYSEKYHLHVEKSVPKNDYDDRNALYSLRFNLHAAALFPKKDFRELALREMKIMVAKFPGGFDHYKEI